MKTGTRSNPLPVDTVEDAFDACREADRPLVAEIDDYEDTGAWALCKVYPSGNLRKIDRRDSDHARRADRLAAEYTEEHESSRDWSAYESEITSGFAQQDENGWLVYPDYFGSALDCPSGTYYMSWTSNRPAESLAQRDEIWRETLESVADEYGISIHGSEDDPCDLIATVSIGPVDEECFIRQRGDRYIPRYCGEDLDPAPDLFSAVEAIGERMKQDEYFPGIWEPVNDYEFRPIPCRFGEGGELISVG